MTDWLDAIMAWIQANPGLAGIVIASTAFLESLALVGILVPGALILFGIGALVGLGAISLAEAWFWSSVGAILGDGLSYWLGSHYRERLNNIWPFSRFTKLIAQGQEYFKKHGGKSIFIGRFVGPIRPVVPLIAGMMKMPVKYYIPINIIAGILWSPAYILPGVVLGASLDLAATVAWRLVVVILIFVGLLWLIYWFFKRIYTFLSPRADRQLDTLLNWCHRHPHIGPVIAPIIDPQLPQRRSLFTMALLLVGASWVFISLLIPALFGQLPFTLDRLVYASIQELRHPYADAFFFGIAQLGSLAVQLPLLFVLIVFLTLRSRFTTAINILGASSAAFILSLLLKLTVTVKAPIALFGDMGSYPSLEVMLATVCYGFLATMLAGELKATKRKWVYIVFFTIIIAAALSRLYLGMHWPSDIIAAWTFGGIWLGIISIAYRRHPHPTLNTPLLSAVIIITISSSYAFQYYSGSYESKFVQLKPQTSMKLVQKKNWLLYPESVIPKQGPGHERMINVQFGASLVELEKRLTSEGWKRATPVSWQSLLLTLSPEPEIERLPVLKITLRDQLPAGQWLKETEQGLVLLHIWPSNIRISQTKRIWLGQKQKVHLSQQFYFLHVLVAQESTELSSDCMRPSAWKCVSKNNIELFY